MSEKSIVLSLVQPSGDLTIGNYLGAISQFVSLQEDYDCYFAAADLHAITVPQEPALLRQRTKEVLAYYIASGIDPNKVTLFIQSQVPQHAELAWVLNTITSLGQLGRMTQYKDKAKKHADHLNAGLLTYPVLMAADILLYQANYVPVGADQKQHLELSRDLAERFNTRYSPTFTVPAPLIPKDCAKIMSLKDPLSKMSKSDPDVNAYILMKDDPETIRRKIARAVTDSKAQFTYSDEQPGLKNLIGLYAAYTNRPIEAVVEQFKDSTYAAFKTELAEEIIQVMEPIRQRFLTILQDKEMLESIYTEGAQKARYMAQKTLRKVYRKVGFIPS